MATFLKAAVKILPSNFIVDFFTMNSSSYLGYLKKRNPLRFISDIFRYYKKTCDETDVKRNQSEPAVVQQKIGRDLDKNKPKSEENLNGLCGTPIEQWTNAKFKNSSSQESLHETWSNSSFERTSSNISLKKKASFIDLNIREKLEKIPMPDESEYGQKSPVKRAYPWQNFNLSKVKYEEVRPVNDIAREMLNWRRPILCKPNSKGKRDSPAKEVKFNDTASLVVYPKNSNGVMKQAKINLSTNICDGGGAAYKKKKRDLTLFNQKINNIKVGSRNGCTKKNPKGKVRLKCMPSEQSGFWYLNKKQKIF